MKKEKSAAEKFQWREGDFGLLDENGKEMDWKDLVRQEKERERKAKQEMEADDKQTTK